MTSQIRGSLAVLVTEVPAKLTHSQGPKRQGPSAPGLLVLERPRGESEHQGAGRIAQTPHPSRFNETAACKLRVSPLVFSSPGGIMVRSCDLLPCAWQGNHVFPGPGEKLGDLPLWGSGGCLLYTSDAADETSTV